MYVERILGQKEGRNMEDGFVDGIYEMIADDEKVRGKKRQIVRSIHLSDMHVDLKYKEGEAAQCHLAICCRDNGKL